MGPYITETWLRESFGLGHGTEIRLPAGSRLTPAAQGLLDERRIDVKYVDEAGRVFLDENREKGAPQRDEPTLTRVHPLTGSDTRPESACMLCHQPVAKKPDTLTHLDARTLVVKNDPRLKLRGKLDTAICQAVLIQAEFDPENLFPALVHLLADIRSGLGNVLKADVTGEAMPPVFMGDFDEEAIHALSHNPLKYLGHDHIVPEMSQGVRVARLNVLRALIREAELVAADVYIARDCTVTRPDVMQGLNRLSSAVYVLMLLTLLAEQGKAMPAGKVRL